MTFRNLQIEIDTLPQASAIEWRTLSPRYPVEVAISAILVGGLITSAVTGLAWFKNGALTAALPALAIGATVTLLITLLAWLSARARRYAVRQHDIAHRTGLLWRKAAFLVFQRIQHIELSHGPLERYFGLATLKFYTAGGATADLKISGLPEEEAGRLRRYLLDREDTTADG